MESPCLCSSPVLLVLCSALPAPKKPACFSSGLSTEGIYRVSGNKSEMESLQRQFDQGKAAAWPRIGGWSQSRQTGQPGLLTERESIRPQLALSPCTHCRVEEGGQVLSANRSIFPAKHTSASCSPCHRPQTLLQVTPACASVTSGSLTSLAVGLTRVVAGT